MMSEKIYTLNTENLEKWGSDAYNGMRIRESELIRLSQEWDTPIDELMDEVEESETKSNIELLKEAQDLLNLNQKEIGIFAGVSARCMNAWMTGERAVPSHVAEMINRLAHADHDALEDVRPTTAMLRWAVITARGIDEWMTVCGNKADALREAAEQWRRLTDDERKKLDRFEVSLVKVQIVAYSPLNCGRFEYYANADGQIDGEVYECAKDYLQG